MSTSPDRPLAYIYDRHATRSPGTLDLRLDGCRTYAERQGWEVAGHWVDRGDDALSEEHRPQLDALCAAMGRCSDARTRVCLVHSWERLCRDAMARERLSRRVALAGGRTVTSFGQSDESARATLAPSEG
ncbi:recombinase family protein [Streptomyces sp. 8N706]|uniref:recombinase family protein n=1 Tax=Streptomyces sp. 8N706 TaxID=3457416 RepID=UPI003FD51CFD